MRAPRGLACADAVDEYRRDVRTWIEAEGTALSRAERSVLESLGDHVTRVRMLEGDVPPESAAQLVEATRDLGVALRTDDDEALERAAERLESLG